MTRRFASTFPMEQPKIPLPEGIGRCDYRLKEQTVNGINHFEYGPNLFSHFIVGDQLNIGKPLCINNDPAKNAKNAETTAKILAKELDLPVYVIVSHGVFDITVKADDTVNKKTGKPEKHYYSPENDNMYTLGERQFIIHPAPLGTVMQGSAITVKNTNKIINNVDNFKSLILSDAFRKSVDIDPRTNDTEHYEHKYKFSSSLFSPPQYSTMNKYYQFEDSERTTTWRFGVIQANKSYEGITHDGVVMPKDYWLSMMGSVKYVVNNETAKLNRTLNAAYPGVFVSDVEKERKFVDVLKKNDYEIAESDMLSIFGDGIYVIANCSPILINITDMKTNKTVRIVDLKDISGDVASIIKSVNKDVEVVVHELGYRWQEMVQNNEYKKRVNPFKFTALYDDNFYETVEGSYEEDLKHALDMEEVVNLNDTIQHSQNIYSKYIKPLVAYLNIFNYKGGKRRKARKTRKTRKVRKVRKARKTTRR